MKKLISAQDIRERKESGCFEIVAPVSQYIVTPEARDVASRLGVSILSDESLIGIKNSSEKQKDYPIKISGATGADTQSDINRVTSEIQKAIESQLGGSDKERSLLIQELIAKELKGFNQTVPECNRQINDNGIVLIRGNALKFDKFDGAPNQNIGIKDCIGKSENSNMGVGYMGWEKAFFPWLLTYDEVDVILEGELHIKTASGTTIGKPGDVIFIPKNTQIEFGTPTFVKFVYITYPVVSF